jgi:FtsZ-binding cell division protein ZapB
MPDSNDHFERLEEKLTKAVEVFKQTHAEKRALQQEVERLRAELKERPKRLDALEHDLQVLRRERDEVRERVEKLIGQIETLTNESVG